MNSNVWREKVDICNSFKEWYEIAITTEGSPDKIDYSWESLDDIYEEIYSLKTKYIDIDMSRASFELSSEESEMYPSTFGFMLNGLPFSVKGLKSLFKLYGISYTTFKLSTHDTRISIIRDLLINKVDCRAVVVETVREESDSVEEVIKGVCIPEDINPLLNETLFKYIYEIQSNKLEMIYSSGYEWYDTVSNFVFIIKDPKYSRSIGGAFYAPAIHISNSENLEKNLRINIGYMSLKSKCFFRLKSNGKTDSIFTYKDNVFSKEVFLGIFDSIYSYFSDFYNEDMDILDNMMYESIELDIAIKDLSVYGLSKSIIKDIKERINIIKVVDVDVIPKWYFIVIILNYLQSNNFRSRLSNEEKFSKFIDLFVKGSVYVGD